MVRIADVRGAAGKGDLASEFGAFAARITVLALEGRTQIIEPEVDGRQRDEPAERRPDGGAAGGVDQADDRPGSEDAALRHSDQLFAPRQGELGPIVARTPEFHAERPAVTDAARNFEEFRRIEPFAFWTWRWVAHAASRCAVSRTSAIMLGIPWVRLALSWRVRSNGASAAATSMSAMSSAGLS